MIYALVKAMPMIKIVTTEQMRAIEAAADASGITYQDMMERAGKSAAELALARLQHINKPLVTVLVGPGNNGGDGLVTGLLMKQARDEVDVRFYLLSSRPEEDIYLQTARKANLFIVEAENDTDKRALRHMVASSDMIIDALFGIGIRLPLRDEASRVLRAAARGINERRRERPNTWTIMPNSPESEYGTAPLIVLAIDGPSGLDFDTGDIDATAIQADETITFIAAKPGLLTFPGAKATGKLSVANLGIPEGLAELNEITDTLMSAETARQLIPERRADGHKGTYGKVLVIAGSINYIGAPLMAAMAAYRSGAGLVGIATPQPLAGALAGHIPEAIWLPLPHDMGALNEAAVDVLSKEIQEYDALLIGPGLGRDKATRAFLMTLLNNYQDGARPTPRKRAIGFGHKQLGDTADDEPAQHRGLPPLVIDADALNLLSEEENWWELLTPETILTPHPGEMGRLTGQAVSEIQANRRQITRETAEAWGVTLVLKGAHTLVSPPDGQQTCLPFKTNALATAGTGDVLAGLIAGLLGQGLNAYDAARLGAYIHGLAGELTAKAVGNRAAIAADVITQIGAAWQALEG